MKRKKINILMISASSKLGGGPKNMFLLGQKLGEDFKVFYAMPKSNFFKAYIKKRNHIYIKERTINPIDLIKLTRFICKNNIDLVHAHGKGASVISRIIKFFLNKPLIYTFHGIHLSCHGFFKRNLYWLYEFLTSYLDSSKVFVSLSEKNYAIDSGVFSGRNSVIINNGVQNKNLKIHHDQKNFKIRKKIKKIKVISICRFVEQKNIKEIIQIAQILKNIDFEIIGDGPMFDEIQNIIYINKIKNLKLFGISENVFERLYLSDIFLSSSLYEGLPISILEAMSVGLPIVASDVIGNSDTIEHSISGYLYKLNEIYEAAKYIKILSDDQNLRIKLGLAAFKRQRKYFSMKKMLTSYEQLYKKYS